MTLLAADTWMPLFPLPKTPTASRPGQSWRARRRCGYMDRCSPAALPRPWTNQTPISRRFLLWTSTPALPIGTIKCQAQIDCHHRCSCRQWPRNETDQLCR